MNYAPSYLTAVCFDFKMLLADEKNKLIVINSLKYLAENGEIVIYGYVCALPEEYKYSSAAFYETGIDIWGLMNESITCRW